MHLSDFQCVTKCIVCALNYAQTIHKPYIERQRVKERKSQREEETKSQRVKERKRKRDQETTSQKVKERERQRVKKTEEAS